MLYTISNLHLHKNVHVYQISFDYPNINKIIMARCIINSLLVISIIPSLVHADVRACMHACMCACVRACVSTCVLACVRACVRTCVRACVRACVRVRTGKCACMYCPI